MPDTGAPRAQRGRVDWAGAVATLRKHPGEALLLDGMWQIPRARYLANAANRKASPHLRMDDGRVVAQVRNGSRDATAPGDLYLTFIPNEEEK